MSVRDCVFYLEHGEILIFAPQAYSPNALENNFGRARVVIITLNRLKTLLIVTREKI